MIMARNGIQFQKGLSLPEFQKLYGIEEQCEAALEKACWPDGFRCPRCHVTSMSWPSLNQEANYSLTTDALIWVEKLPH